MKNILLIALVLILMSPIFAQHPNSLTIKGMVNRNGLTSNLTSYSIRIMVISTNKDTITQFTSINSKSMYSVIFPKPDEKSTIKITGFRGAQIFDEREISHENDKGTYTINLVEKTSSKTFTAGDELKLFTRNMYMGYGLTAAGTSIILVSTLFTDSNGKLPFGALITGGALNLFGTIMLLEAPIHIKRAGLILNQSGVGISLKLDK
jgi:hypothetical protein